MLLRKVDQEETDDVVDLLIARLSDSRTLLHSMEIVASVFIRFFWPDGRSLPDVPPAPTWSGPALASTDAHLETAGLKIDPHTATPDSYGERLDLNWAITVLHPATADPVRRDDPAGIAPGEAWRNGKPCST